MSGKNGFKNEAAGKQQSAGLLKQAKEALGGSLVPEQLDLATDLSGFAERYYARGQLAQAELAYILAGALQEAILGGEDLDAALTVFNLAAVNESQGKLEAAERLYRHALRVVESRLGEDHPDVVVGLQSLAACCLAQGKYAKAEVLHRRMLTVWERTLGPDHPIIAARLDRYADLLRLLNREEEALKAQARSRKIRSRQEHPI